MKNLAFSLLLMAIGFTTYAQTKVTGTVVDSSTGTPIPGVNITISAASDGTATDFDGKFSFETDQSPPFELKASSIGFESSTLQVTQNNQSLSFTLKEGTLLDEVVVSASRTPERIFESPVTVERFGIKEIQNTASIDFYDGLENLKGVDINTNSLTFKAINTRGFATFANTRFMQLVDGMDNSAPALNFPLGNLLGMIETDVNSVELLPGASSALYGANAFNGILFMTSKNPFDSPGISGYSKIGITSQEAAGNNSYTDVGVRVAHKFSDKWAAKVNFGYLRGTDWAANNRDGKAGTGATRADIDYDGVNVYGDEVSENIKSVTEKLIKAGVPGFNPGLEDEIPDVKVSRTGYDESDLTDYKAESIKADWGVYYRPNENGLEFSYVGKYGSGSTIYQGVNRYSIDNFWLTQHKFEIKNDHFFVRAYVTEDNAGDSYDMVFTGININRAQKSDQIWYAEYIGAYKQAFDGNIPGVPGGIEDVAHATGRTVADGATTNGPARFEPGTPEFKEAFDASITNPDLSVGSKFQDNSKIYHGDFNGNLSEYFDFAEIQLGGSFRRYSLNSSGTIYTDTDGAINYQEMGFYAQLQKGMLKDERLKLTASVRYDKSELFDGFFSPRVSLGYSMGAEKNHNIRASFQTGFRNPTTQDLFIGLNAGRAVLVGGEESNPSRYEDDYTVSRFAQDNLGQPAVITQTGESAYNGSLNSKIGEYLGGHNPLDDGKDQVANPDFVKPEQVTSIEIGYRGKLNKVIIDISAYHNNYQDFLSNETVVATYYGNTSNFDLTGYDPQNPASIGGLNPDTQMILAALSEDDFQAYQVYTNTDADVSSYGAAASVNTKIFGGYDLGINYTYAKLEFDQEANPNFQTNFNTPEHKVKTTFGHPQIVKNLGFNVAWRWSESYLWEATFGNGQVPAFHVVDAQVNFNLPALKSTLKVGATNLLGDEYFTAFGTGYIGSQYYFAFTVNSF